MAEVKEGGEDVHPEEVVDGTATTMAERMEGGMRLDPRGVGGEVDVGGAGRMMMGRRGVVVEVVAGGFVLFVTQVKLLFTCVCCTRHWDNTTVSVIAFVGHTISGILLSFMYRMVVELFFDLL